MVQQIWASRVDAFIREQNCFVIDLRDRYEYARGHLKQAVRMDAEFIEEQGIDLPKQVPILLYCEGGSISLKIARLLSMRGYHVYNLAGGYDAYLRVKKTLQL